MKIVKYFLKYISNNFICKAGANWEELNFYIKLIPKPKANYKDI